MTIPSPVPPPLATIRASPAAWLSDPGASWRVELGFLASHGLPDCWAEEWPGKGGGDCLLPSLPSEEPI